MDKQEIFNAVVEHAKTMRRKAFTESTCRYRTADGNRCFMGCLIPDGDYRYAMEGYGIKNLIRRGLWKNPPDWVNADNSYFLLRLQGVHDGALRQYWPDRLRVIATEHDLDSSSVDELGKEWAK